MAARVIALQQAKPKPAGNCKEIFHVFGDD
jgi:hypothetical protein